MEIPDREITSLCSLLLPLDNSSAAPGRCCARSAATAHPLVSPSSQSPCQVPRLPPPPNPVAPQLYPPTHPMPNGWDLPLSAISSFALRLARLPRCDARRCLGSNSGARLPGRIGAFMAVSAPLLAIGWARLRVSVCVCRPETAPGRLAGCRVSFLPGKQ